MGLLIEPSTVTAVLLADGWHAVDQLREGGSSFSLDADGFGFTQADNEVVPLRGGGANGVCAAGFQFMEKGVHVVSGPLISVLAVRHMRGTGHH